MTMSDKEDMLLSIIIATYNRSFEVIRAIESIFPLNIKNYEMIVWDNHSQEKDHDIVRNYCESRKENILYYYAEKNLGAGGGKNAAWLESKGKYVFIMDDDAVIHSEHYFSKLVNYMEQHPKVGAVYTDIYEPASNKHYDCMYKNHNIRIENEKNNIAMDCYIGNVSRALAFVGGAHIVRREAIATKNLYPRYSMFGSEETYASLLIWNNGYEVHNLADIGVYHLPTPERNFSGEIREKKIIVTAFLMKKMIYPISLQLIMYVAFRLHLKKNGFQYDDECKEILNTSFCQEDVKRIGIVCLIELANLFGIRGLI